MMREKSQLTTLCYIEQDEKYLMLHRVKKEKDVNKDKWIGIGGIRGGEARRNVFCERRRRKQGLPLPPGVSGVWSPFWRRDGPQNICVCLLRTALRER